MYDIPYNFKSQKLDETLRIYKTKEFTKWLNKQDKKTTIIVTSRLYRIEFDGYLGAHRYFEKIIELKWKSGLRIYANRYNRNTLIILYGGSKHGQERDIEKSKAILASIFKKA
jgi:putative addiction module killer protein